MKKEKQVTYTEDEVKAISERAFIEGKVSPINTYESREYFKKWFNLNKKAE